MELQEILNLTTAGWLWEGVKYTGAAYGVTMAVRTVAAGAGRWLGVFPPGWYSKFCWLPYIPPLRQYLRFSAWREERHQGTKARGGFASYLQRLTMLYKPGMIYLGRDRLWRIGALRPLGVPGRGASILIGKARSGKSAHMIARAAMWQGNLMAFDVDGTLTRVLAKRLGDGGGSIIGADGKFFCFDFNGHLRDILETARWNFFEDMDRAVRAAKTELDAQSAAVRWADNIADALIAEDNSSQPFFAQSSKAFIKALILFVYVRRETKSLVEVRELLTRGLHREATPAQAAKPAQNGRPAQEARPAEDPHNLLFFFMEQTEDFGGIIARGGAIGRMGKTKDGRNVALSTALSQTSWIDDPALAYILSGSDFSVSEFKTGALSVTLAGSPGEMKSRLRPFYKIFLSACLFTAETIPGAGVRPCQYLLDEWCALGATGGLSLQDLPAIYPKYGCVATFAAQETTQVEEVYGKCWETFFNNVDAITFLATESPSTINLIFNKLDVRTHDIEVAQGEDQKPRIVSQERPVMTRDDIRRFLSAANNNAIVFVAGARALKVKNGKYFRENSVWQVDADPQYKEPFQRAWARRMVAKYLARRNEARAGGKDEGRSGKASAASA